MLQINLLVFLYFTIQLHFLIFLIENLLTISKLNHTYFSLFIIYYIFFFNF